MLSARTRLNGLSPEWCYIAKLLCTYCYYNNLFSLLLLYFSSSSELVIITSARSLRLMARKAIGLKMYSNRHGLFSGEEKLEHFIGASNFLGLRK